MVFCCCLVLFKSKPYRTEVSKQKKNRCLEIFKHFKIMTREKYSNVFFCVFRFLTVGSQILYGTHEGRLILNVLRKMFWNNRVVLHFSLNGKTKDR